MDEIRNNKCLQTFAFITIILVIAYIMNNAYFSKLEGFDNTEAISNIASLYNQSLLTVTKMKTNEILGNPTLTLTGNTNVKGDLTVNGNFINATINKKIDDAIDELKKSSKSYGELYVTKDNGAPATNFPLPLTTSFQSLSPSSTLAPSINFSKHLSSSIVYNGSNTGMFLITFSVRFFWATSIWFALAKNNITLPQSITYIMGGKTDCITISTTVQLARGDTIGAQYKGPASSTFYLYGYNLVASQIN